MATIKAYTDLPQSKKLAEILPLESADMYFYDKDAFTGALSAFNEGVLIRDSNNEFPNKTIPCWSLAALLSVLPHIQEFYPIIGKINDKYVCRYKGSIWTNGTNPVDACYEMILKLHESNLL